MDVQRFAVIDVETTGLDPVTDRIIEIGIVFIDSSLDEVDTWHSLIRPDVPVRARHIHGLSDADVARAPAFTDVAADLLASLEGSLLVAHNVAFDRAFLNAELARANIDYEIPDNAGVCTMDQSRIYCPDGSHSLIGLAQRLNIPAPEHHRALPDARLSAELLRLYIRREHEGIRYTQQAVNRHGATVRPAQWLTSRSISRGADL